MNNATLQPVNHEQSVVLAFVQRNKQERFLGFLANPKSRKKFTDSLAHFRWFDERFATSIPWKADPNGKLWERHVQGIENIYKLLRSRGAGPTCWAISEDTEIDARELDLRGALEHVNGRQIGTILSCIPGKLAYFEGEDETPPARSVALSPAKPGDSEKIMKKTLVRRGRLDGKVCLPSTGLTTASRKPNRFALRLETDAKRPNSTLFTERSGGSKMGRVK